MGSITDGEYTRGGSRSEIEKVSLKGLLEIEQQRARQQKNSSADSLLLNEEKPLPPKPGQAIDQNAMRKPASCQENGVQSHEVEQAEVSVDSKKIEFPVNVTSRGSQLVNDKVTASATQHKGLDHAAASSPADREYKPHPIGSSLDQSEKEGGAVGNLKPCHIDAPSKAMRDDRQNEANKPQRPLTPTEQDQRSPELTADDIFESTLPLSESLQAATADSIAHHQEAELSSGERDLNESSEQERGRKENELPEERGSSDTKEPSWYEGKDLSQGVMDAIQRIQPLSDEEEDRIFRKFNSLEEQQEDDEAYERDLQEAISKGPEAWPEFAKKHGSDVDIETMHHYYGSVRMVEADTRRISQSGAAKELRDEAVAAGLIEAHVQSEFLAKKGIDLDVLETGKPSEDELGLVYDVTSCLASIFPIAAKRMLPSLKAEIEKGHQKILFPGRDAKLLFYAVRQEDPVFHEKHCVHLGFSRKSFQKAANDPDERERISPEEAARRSELLAKNYPIKEPVEERGQYKAHAEMLKEGGVNVESEALVTIVDNGAYGTIPGTLECIFPNVKTQSHFMWAGNTDRDYLEGRKKGHLREFNIPREALKLGENTSDVPSQELKPDENNPDGSEVRRPYDSRLKGHAERREELFEKRASIVLLEEIFQGPQGTMLGAVQVKNPYPHETLMLGNGCVYRRVAGKAALDKIRFAVNLSEEQMDEELKKAEELLLLANLPPEYAAKALETHEDRESLTKAVSILHKIRDNPMIPWPSLWK